MQSLELGLLEELSKFLLKDNELLCSNGYICISVELKMKPDQEKVRVVLLDSIMMLCKNALVYKHRVVVQGLIGVTIDDGEIFLIHFDKQFDKKPPMEQSENSDAGQTLPLLSFRENAPNACVTADESLENQTACVVNQESFTKIKKTATAAASMPSSPLKTNQEQPSGLESSTTNQEQPSGLESSAIAKIVPGDVAKTAVVKSTRTKKSISGSLSVKVAARKSVQSGRMSSLPPTLQVARTDVKLVTQIPREKIRATSSSSETKQSIPVLRKVNPGRCKAGRSQDIPDIPDIPVLNQELEAMEENHDYHDFPNMFEQPMSDYYFFDEAPVENQHRDEFDIIAAEKRSNDVAKDEMYLGSRTEAGDLGSARGASDAITITDDEGPSDKDNNNKQIVAVTEMTENSSEREFKKSVSTGRKQTGARSKKKSRVAACDSVLMLHETGPEKRNEEISNHTEVINHSARSRKRLSNPIVSEVNSSQVGVGSEEADQSSELKTVTAATPTAEGRVSVFPEKWFAVFWNETHHWFIGRAIKKVGEKWQMCFIHQPSPECNLFNMANDIEEIDEGDIFASVDAPAPVSSTRTQSFRLSDADFRAVLKAFREIYV